MLVCPITSAAQASVQPIRIAVLPLAFVLHAAAKQEMFIARRVPVARLAKPRPQALTTFRNVLAVARDNTYLAAVNRALPVKRSLLAASNRATRAGQAPTRHLEPPRAPLAQLANTLAAIALAARIVPLAR